jgi:hypothetical protein
MLLAKQFQAEKLLAECVRCAGNDFVAKKTPRSGFAWIPA